MTQKENKQTFADFATLTDAELMEISGGKRHWWDIIIFTKYNMTGGKLNIDVTRT